MILRSIELESFGKFRGEQFEFRRGMNLVIGPNEAGKSTLAEAIPAVLFGSDRLERLKPWGRNACAAALNFEGQGRTVRIRRNLLTDEVELVESDDLYHVLSQFTGKVPPGGRAASCREYFELLETLLGVSDEGVFRATCFFGHHPQEWRGGELAQKLRSLVGGSAESDYAQILDGLLEEHFQLTRSNPWGRDKQRDREYEEVCAQLESCGAAETVPVFVEIDPAVELSGQIDVLAGEIASDRAEYAKGERYVAHLRAQRDEGGEGEPAPEPEVEEPVARIAEPAESVPAADIAERLAAVGLPKNPPACLPELLEEAASIRQELAELQQPSARLNSQEKKIPAMPWLALSCGAVGVVIALGACWWFGGAALWLVAGGAVGLAALVTWGIYCHRQRGRQLEACRKERARLDQMKSAAQRRQTDLSERCEALGLPSTAIDLVRLQKQVASHRELLDAYWSGCSVPPGGSVTASPVVTRPDPVVRPESEDVTELRRLEERLAAFAEQLREKEERLAALRQQLQKPAEAAVPATSRSALIRRRDELEERIRVLRKAIDLLAGAVETFGKSHLVRLNEEASRLFGKLTAGRHTAVQFDENMAPQVQVDGRRWQPAEHFSRGTVDALYLTLRVALARVRGDGRSLPLVFDDPFVHLDQKRLATALNIVDLAAADGQLILLSHNLELGKRAARERWHVVTVDGDQPRAATEEGADHAGQLHLL